MKLTGEFTDKKIGHEKFASICENKKLTIPFEVKQVKEDEDFFYFSGYGSTFGNIDRGDDVIEKGAFVESLKNEMPKLLWQHKMSEPLGIFTNAFEDDRGLFVTGKMPKSDDFVRGRVIPQIKVGSISSMSIGFSIPSDGAEIRKMESGSVRFIKKVNLFEISLVTIPMNTEADITGFKSAFPFKDLPFPMIGEQINFNRSWDSAAAVKRVRSFLNSEDGPSESYKNAFLWYDKANQSEFGAYKLPIADVIDGHLVAIPRAIFASAAVLRGGRGGADIPESDRDQIIKNVNRYYEKMDRPSPFQKGFSVLIDDIDNIKDISQFLKTCFSNNESNSIINAIKRVARADIERQKEADKQLIESFSKNLKEISAILSK